MYTNSRKSANISKSGQTLSRPVKTNGLKCDWVRCQSFISRRSKLSNRPPPSLQMEALLFILLFPTKKGLNSLYAVPFPHKLHFLKLVQTSSKFRLSFVCAKNEARQDFSSCYLPCSLTRKVHAVWFQFCPSSEDRANFPFVCPPLNVEAVLASVLWDEEK